MSTNLIPRKLFGCHPKREERERAFGNQTDRRINSSNPKTGTGQNGLTLADDDDDDD
jgi:hypothetical protein